MTTAPNPGSNPQRPRRPQRPRGATRAGALARLRAARKPKNPTGDMTLVEHLQELRRRLFFAVLFIGIGTIVGFYWYAQAPFGWPSLRPAGEPSRLVYQRQRVPPAGHQAL